MKNTYALLCSFLCCFYIATGETIPDSCLYKILQREEQFINDAFKKGRCWYLKYYTITETHSETNDSIQKVKNYGVVMATAFVRITNSSEIDVYMDSIDIYTIYKKKKIIVRTKSPENIFREVYNNYLVALRDKAFQDMKIDSVYRKQQEIVLHLRPASGKQGHVYSEVVIRADATSWDLKTIHTVFNSTKVTKLISHTFEIENKKEIKIPAGYYDIKKLVFTPSGKLQDAYKSYQYKDLTN
jgi:hypothetical protein